MRQHPGDAVAQPRVMPKRPERTQQKAAKAGADTGDMDVFQEDEGRHEGLLIFGQRLAVQNPNILAIDVDDPFVDQPANNPRQGFGFDR